MQHSFKVGQVLKIKKWGNKPHPTTAKKINNVDEKGRIDFVGSDTKYSVCRYGTEIILSAVIGNHNYSIIY